MKTHKLLFLYLLEYALLSLPAILQAEPLATNFTLEAAALEQRGQFKQLRYHKASNTIKLDDMELIEDDAPAIGMPKGASDRSWFERLHKGIRIRKELVLDDPRAFSGYLVFNGLEMKDNTFPLNISINGHQFLRPPSRDAHPFAKQYYTREWAGDLDNWFFVEIPVGALKKGANEFILWADSDDTSWEIMVASDEEYIRGSSTRTHHPNRSTKSRDGGSFWDFDKLGWKDELDGEYCIRLSLDRYVSEGTYISPVIDMVNPAGEDTIKKRVDISSCSLKWDMDVPNGSEAVIFVRTSNNPVPSSGEWSKYRAIDGSDLHDMKNPNARYLQFKAVLKTGNPLVTPALKGLAISTTYEVIEPPQSNIFYRLVDFRNGEVIRPSVDFTHEDFAKLKEYRERFRLDDVVANAHTEFEAQLLLMKWAYEIPIGNLDRYAWDFYDLPQQRFDEDGNIQLDTEFKSRGRRRVGHCLYCNLTLIGACLAMGYPARWVNIATRSTYGHEVTEVWSNDFNKWIFLDATRDYYIYDPDTGIPMNLIEINDRLQEIMPRQANWEFPIRWLVPSDSLAYNVDIAYREGFSSTFSIKDVNQGPHLLLLMGQLHTPVRNDFASRHDPVPWRISSNWGGNLFYGYYNDIFPRKREYSLHTDRPQDFNYPLNQSELTVSETVQPGVLRVDIDTETPCFETFVMQTDESGWQEIPGSTFEWMLHEGLNRLRVQTRNTAGVLGPESYVSVVMNN
ncbi:MAG: hypothetical protein JXB48_16000 [Candidatus Latescibacteria bacterium]|nr:hypothetical protein [Candidatus Latescibacterota bacterium]